MWELAAYVAAPLLVISLVRPILQPGLVEAAPLFARARRQFRLDMGLYLFAALLGAIGIHLVAGFPFVHSGLKLGLSISTMGLFASLDSALAKERDVIAEARTRRGAMRPPRRMTSLTRRFSLVAVVIMVLLAVVLLLVLTRDIHWLAAQPATPETFETITRAVLLEILFVMGALLVLVVNLILSSSRNLKMLFENETEALDRVSRGDLNVYAPVATNDEFGYIAGQTNTMIEGLRDRLKMRKGLEIAREVQVNFLPKTVEAEGMQAAGKALFSDETGGDFFDFIQENGKVVILAADVVGHGIGAALLMASCRAYLRQAASDPALSLADVAGTANRQLCGDVEGTGRFVTGFLVQYDIASREVFWVGAGHPSAVLYTPASGELARLKSFDIPLGVDAQWTFRAERLEPSAHERYLLLLTDGVTEARSGDDMFGDRRLEVAIRRGSTGSASELVDEVARSVGRFCPRPDDDVTLVAVRLDPTL